MLYLLKISVSGKIFSINVVEGFEKTQLDKTKKKVLYLEFNCQKTKTTKTRNIRNVIELKIIYFF